MDVKVVSHMDEVLKEVDDRIELALDTVGITAVSDVQILTPVDTGRLRASISHQTSGKGLYIGTNVEYGKYVEYGDKATHKNGQAHFLRDGLQNNISKYESIIRDILTSM